MRETLERQAFLQEIDALRGLSVSALQGIATAVEELSLPVDAYLFREGDVADGVFILRSGSVRIIVQRPPTGGAAVVSQVAAGNVFGEAALLAGSARVASAMTDIPSVVWKLPRSAFEAVSRVGPVVKRRGSPPAASTIQMLETYASFSSDADVTTNATRRPSGEICGSLTPRSRMRSEATTGRRPRQGH